MINAAPGSADLDDTGSSRSSSGTTAGDTTMLDWCSGSLLWATVHSLGLKTCKCINTAVRKLSRSLYNTCAMPHQLAREHSQTQVFKLVQYFKIGECVRMCRLGIRAGIGTLSTQAQCILPELPQACGRPPLNMEYILGSVCCFPINAPSTLRSWLDQDQTHALGTSHLPHTHRRKAAADTCMLQGVRQVGIPVGRQPKPQHRNSTPQ